MTEYTLPFTCKTRDKAIWIYCLIVSPILGIIGFIGMYPDLISNTKNHIIYMPLAIHISFFIPALLLKAVEHRDKLPTFKCKCDEQQSKPGVEHE